MLNLCLTSQTPPAPKARASLRTTRWYHHLLPSGRNARLHSRFSVLWYRCSREPPFWRVSCGRAFMLGDFTQTPSQVQVRKDLRMMLLVCRFLCGSPSLMECIPLNHLCFIICRRKIKQIDKQERIVLFNKTLVTCLILECVFWAPTEWVWD